MEQWLDRYVTFEIYRFIKRLRLDLVSYEMGINIFELFENHISYKLDRYELKYSVGTMRYLLRIHPLWFATICNYGEILIWDIDMIDRLINIFELFENHISYIW